MPDYVNILVEVVVTLGVINRVPAAIPEHNVFCYSTVAHILTLSVNLFFGPKSGFKNTCRSRTVFGLVISGSGRVQASKWGPFTTPCGYVCRSQQGEIERMHPPLTISKYRLKSFCEVSYADFRPNVFGAGKMISMEILVGEGWGCNDACMMPSSIKNICSFSKKWKCARKMLIVFVTLSDSNKTSNRAVTHTSYKAHDSWSVLV